MYHFSETCIYVCHKGVPSVLWYTLRLQMFTCLSILISELLIATTNWQCSMHGRCFFSLAVAVCVSVRESLLSNCGSIIVSTLWIFWKWGQADMPNLSLCQRLASLDGIFYVCIVPSPRPSHKVRSSAPRCLLLLLSHSCWPQPQSTAALLDTVRNGKRERRCRLNIQP